MPLGFTNPNFSFFHCLRIIVSLYSANWLILFMRNSWLYEARSGEKFNGKNGEKPSKLHFPSCSISFTTIKHCSKVYRNIRIPMRQMKCWNEKRKSFDILWTKTFLYFCDYFMIGQAKQRSDQKIYPTKGMFTFVHKNPLWCCQISTWDHFLQQFSQYKVIFIYLFHQFKHFSRATHINFNSFRFASWLQTALQQPPPPPSFTPIIAWPII